MPGHAQNSESDTACLSTYFGDAILVMTVDFRPISELMLERLPG
jgi:hypothetical protein